MVQPLGRTVWRLLKTAKTEAAYDPAVPVLGGHLDRNVIHRHTCTPVRTVALLSQGAEAA